MTQSSYEHSSHNSTITTSVSIRVTPIDDYLVSWGILWCGFVATSTLACYQVWKDYKASSNRSDDIENGPGGVAGDEGATTADGTRSMFRKWLLLANVARIIFMPVQIWADPIVFQFLSDTLPEMLFASAWTLLVSFFVQLVGIASGTSGTGTSIDPGTVIQMTSYILYIILVLTFFVNPVASVLLYALLCCIYAALFGTVVYFCPRLLILLKPSLDRYPGLTVRLGICSTLCIVVFVSHTVGYAINIVAPPRKVYWWWNYGALELLPSTLFLILMHPSSENPDAKAQQQSSSRKNSGSAGIPRNLSANSGPSGNPGRKSGESTPLLQQSPTYGASVQSS